jgi:hypothetical protein
MGILTLRQPSCFEEKTHLLAAPWLFSVYQSQKITDVRLYKIFTVSECSEMIHHPSTDYKAKCKPLHAITNTVSVYTCARTSKIPADLCSVKCPLCAPFPVHLFQGLPGSLMPIRQLLLSFFYCGHKQLQKPVLDV